ncbi:MAG: hypothetical protein GXP52_08860 [Deltaproteobacteria bacterium]|nr:hypothetical protein [Deltaproteobacteria bacterium]
MGRAGGTTINLFMVASPLHYFCARIIAERFCRDEARHLFFTRDFLSKIVSEEGWDSVTYLPWPRFYPKGGIFGKICRTRENLDIVAGKCPDAGFIRLHAPVIDTEAVNYHINFLRHSFPEARFTVRLIPDGLLNVQRHPLGISKKIGQYLKKLRRLVFPSLNYYIFKGDRTGSDDPIVDRIYVLPDIPHEYQPSKIVELPSFYSESVQSTEDGDLRNALVLSQPMSSMGHLSDREVVSIAHGIHQFLDGAGIEDIHFKRHPRDPRRDFFLPDYHEIEPEKPLEDYLVNHPYKIVIGFSSTGLVTAKMILGGRCRVVSYGLDVVKEKGVEQRKKFERMLSDIGVEVVAHSADQ